MSGAPQPGFALQKVSVRVEGARLLQDIDLTIPAGRWTALIGPSGSGKSTLLRLLDRLVEPSSGCVLWRGRPLPDYDVRALRRDVGLLVQQPRLSGGTARHNLMLPVTLGSLSQRQAQERLPRACEVAQLDRGLLERQVASLSGGERQRVALARVLILQPSALLLDEPTSALDPSTARRMMAALDGLRRERGVTLVVVTHRLQEIARLDGECAVLDRGRLVERDRAARILSAPRSEVARILLSDDGEEGEARAGAD